MQRKPIAEVIKENSEALMEIEGVVGLYEGRLEDQTPCIKIMVVEYSKELEEKLPDELNGYPVVIDETGKIEPMN